MIDVRADVLEVEPHYLENPRFVGHCTSSQLG
jgi:hypothetical protein